jgi:YHS domain-containing protein
MLVRLLIYLVIGVLIYRAAKSWFGGNGKRQVGGADRGLQRADDALVQDPQCGVYLTRRDGVPLDTGGETLYFCSESCKQQFLADKHRSETSS